MNTYKEGRDISVNVSKIKSFLNGALTPAIFAIIAVFLFVMINSTMASAATNYNDSSTSSDQKLKMYLYGLLVSACYQGGSGSTSDNVETDNAKVDIGQFFYESAWSGHSPVVYTVNQTILSEVPDFGDDYWTHCGDDEGKLTKMAIAAWGVGATDLVCAMGYVRDADGADCKQSTSFDYKSNGGIDNRDAKFKAALKSLTGLDLNNPGNDILYLRWADVVKNACTTGTGVPLSEASVSGDLRYELKEVKNGAIVTNVYSGGNKKSEKPHNTPISYTCGDALTNANKYINDYLTSVVARTASSKCEAKGYQDIDGGSFPDQVDLSACIAGAQHQGQDSYCATAFPDITYQGASVSRDSARKACLYGQGAELNTDETVAGDSTDPEAETATTCAVEAVGWIICPVVKFLAFIGDASFNFLADSFLEVKASAFDTSGAAYKAWSWMRNIANVMFVIAFMFIIFSQLTGVGVSNYGVKKLLPRIIISAILVNVSYFISQLAIDLSNILGYGIRQIFDFAASGTGLSADEATNTFATGGGLAGIAGGILAGAVAGVALYAALSTLIPIILAAVIALVMILFILIARQAIIVLLVVLSPIAFVAFLLPNTERLFKMWRQMLTAMLLLFPIIALIFGASALASTVLTAAFASSNADGGDWFGQLMGAAILTVPLFAVPVVLKKALDGVPMLGQMANRLSGRANANVGKKLRESHGESRFAAGRQFRKQRNATNRALAKGGQYEGNNPFLKARSGFNSGVNAASSRFGDTKLGSAMGAGQFGEKLTAQAIGVANADDTEQIKLAEQKIRRESLNDPGKARSTLSSALKSGDKVAARAAQNVLFTQGAGGMNNFYQAVAEAQDETSANYAGGTGSKGAAAVDSLRENINTNHGQFVKQKAADISKWASTGGVGGSLAATTADGDTWSNLSQQDMSQQTQHSLKRAQEHLDGKVAGELLNNKTLKGNLDDGQVAALTHAKDKAVTAAAVAGGAPLPVPDTRATTREFSREQIATMGPENVQRVVDSRGGMGNLSDGDVVSIANAHGSTPIGQAARTEVSARQLSSSSRRAQAGGGPAPTPQPAPQPAPQPRPPTPPNTPPTP